MANFKNSDSYDDALSESLRDPAYAAEYLNVHLAKDEGDSDEDAERLFLIALRNVARAHGVSAIAERTALGRESLYKALSAGGNPKLTTLRAVLDAMGLQLSIHPRHAA
ncbi:MAG: putative addiction module antidote protein [Myxococcales bacterium]|nr:putative addiction module antidote protein [Myxococcales bacterium]